LKEFAKKSGARLIFPIGVLLLIIFSGCNQTKDSLIRRFIPLGSEAIATNYINLLREGKYEQIEADLNPSLKTPNIRDTLAGMASKIPSEDPKSVKVIGAYNNIFGSDSSEINLTFEYQFPSQWLLINVATQKKNGISSIVGLNVYPLSDSLENLNRFTLVGKGIIQYVTLAFAILIPLFTLYALVLCVRTKMEKRKWLWIIFILAGLGKFTINWTTGQWNFAPLSFQLLGSSSFAPPYGAWLISISLPMGAILFLFRRKRHIASIEPAIPSS
jgi:hypothetical protein